MIQEQNVTTHTYKYGSPKQLSSLSEVIFQKTVPEMAVLNAMIIFSISIIYVYIVLKLIIFIVNTILLQYRFQFFIDFKN